MGKLSSLSAKKVIKAFERAGFSIISQKGSHIKMRRTLLNGFTQTIIVPNHKVVKEGTLRKGILRPIGMTEEEFISFL
jgi:predicted RNA binding protein YcfA (HicA-like mRNA interferase family)